jgi:hypothetical protein
MTGGGGFTLSVTTTVCGLFTAAGSLKVSVPL